MRHDTGGSGLDVDEERKTKREEDSGDKKDRDKGEGGEERARE
jgi:hypothetical protein